MKPPASNPSLEVRDAPANAVEPRPTGDDAGLLSVSLRMAWRWKWLLAAGCLLGLGAGYYRTLNQHPVYSSSADLLVIRKRPNALPVPNMEPGAYEDSDDFLDTHLELLKSPLILERAGKRLQGQHLATFAGESNPVNFLRGAFKVSRNRPGKETVNTTSRILSLSINGPVAEDCPVILQAIIDAYRGYLEDTYQNSSGTTVKLIQEAREVLDKELAQKTAAYRVFRENTPPQVKGKDNAGVLQETQGSAQAHRAALRVRCAEIRGKLEAVEQARREGRSASEIAGLIAPNPERPNSITTLQDQLYPLLVRESQLETQFGPDHPELAAVRKRIALTRDLYAHRPEELGGSSEAESRNRIEAYVRSQKHELAVLEAEEKALTQLIEEQRGEARSLTTWEVQDELLRADLTRTQQLYDSIVKRLQEVNLVKDLGGFEAVVIVPPGLSETPAPGKARELGTMSFFGLACALGLAFGLEFRNKRFRSPEDVSGHLNAPVMGHLPLASSRPAARRKGAQADAPLDAMLHCYHNPRSVDAECYRALRTALFSRMRRETDRVLQVTSPAEGDGKSTLAANLAVSIAQAGLRTLLLDADFRKPRLNRLLGVSRKIGLTSVLREESELDRAIQETCVPGLFLLPSGPTVANPADLLMTPRFGEVLQRARKGYDFVVIDSPPVLAVADPCIVAQQADAVLLVVHVTRTERPQAERAREILDSAGAYVLGVAVNAVQRTLSYGSYYRHGEVREYDRVYAVEEAE